jgi:hypothetical protein
MNHIELAKEIEDRYRRYLRTTFYIKDPELRNSFRSALERGGIAKGPYLEASPPYRRGLSPELLFPEVLGESVDPAFLRALNGDRALYQHQEVAVSRVTAGRNTLVATGTGSDKTECFLYPILLHLYREFEQGRLTERPGVRALVLYPMNALAYDQRERLGGLYKRLEDQNARFRFSFGQYIGATPEDARDRFRHAAEVIDNRLPGELVTRQEMRETPPHILLTNFSMLEYQLVRPQDSPLFDGFLAQSWTFLVLDEAHQYRGTRGAEMGLLLRRLKERIRASGNNNPFRCIATSATLASGDHDRTAVAGFAKDLFDEDFYPDDVILAERETLPESSETILPYAAYATLLEALDTGNPAKIREIDFPAEGATAFPEGAAVPMLVGRILSQDRRTRDLQRKLQDGPRDVFDVSNVLFPELPQHQRIEVLSTFIDTLNRAQEPSSGGPFLSARYHLFLRALEGAFVRYMPEKEALLVPQGQGEPAGPAFEMALCRECGQHYLVGRHSAGRLLEAVRDPSRDDFGVSFFRPIEVGDEDQSEFEGPALNKFDLCVRCGFMWRHGANPACDHQSVLIIEEQSSAEDQPDQIQQCTACGYSGPDPVREVIHGGDGPHAMIATTLFERIDQESKKILAFADSRQEAAYFAWYLDDTYQSILRRNFLYRAIADASADDNEPLSLEDLAHEYRRLCARERVTAENPSQRERRRNAWTEVYRELLSPETRIALSGVGLVRWSIQWPKALEPPSVLTEAPWSLSREDALTITFSLIDSLRRDRAVELMPDDIGLDWSDLGITGSQRLARLGPPYGQQNVVSWNGPKGWRAQYMRKVLEKRGYGGADTDSICDTTLRATWGHLTNFSDQQPPSECLLLHVRDGRRLNPIWYRVSPIEAETPIWQCDRCNRLEAIAVGDVCPRHGCRGRLVPTPLETISDNHYRRLYQGHLPGNLVVEEHTAQLATDRAREIQGEFQRGRVHVLSCSTTFELGVDLGDLNTVFLRNVPPESFNYIQRVGRAGRRAGSPGFAVTYCRRGPHDLYHFADPVRLLSGGTKPPPMSLQNVRVAERHLAAVVLAKFFRGDPTRFESVQNLVGDWSNPTLISSLRSHIDVHRAEFDDDLRHIFPKPLLRQLDAEGSWFGKVVGQDSRLARAEMEVVSDFRRLDQLEDAARRERKYDQANWAARRKRTIASEDVLSFLSRKAVIPKYGFPVDVVELETQQTSRQAQNVSLTRDLAIAIGEFAPTATLVASKQEWQSYGLKRVPEKEFDRKHYKVCHQHNLMIAWSENEPTPELPCGDHARTRTYVIPSFGFLTSTKPASAPRHRPTRLFTTRPYFLGSVGAAPETIELPESGVPTVTIRKAAPGRLAVLCEGRRGAQFHICGSCGAGFLSIRSGARHQTPWGRDCRGTLSPLSLAHEFVTDVVQIQFHPLPPAEAGGLMIDPVWLGYGVATALLEGVAEEIQVPATDLNATIGRSDRGGLPAILLYDAVPGGAGLVARLEQPEIFRASLEAAQRRVRGDWDCGEDASCYGCLRSYRNQFAHTYLKRGPVKRYLELVLDQWRS